MESDPKSEFSNGYNSVIFKVKIYDKISRHSELPREFKTAKIFFFKLGRFFIADDPHYGSSPASEHAINKSFEYKWGYNLSTAKLQE